LLHTSCAEIQVGSIVKQAIRNNLASI